jgi:hypothetical protein
LLLFFQRWNVPRGLATVGVLLVLVHPAAFFLVASYSESLFLFCLLGFLYFVDEDTPSSRPSAALLGFLMTATRLVGVPLAVYPLLRGWLNRSSSVANAWSWKRVYFWFMVAGVAGLGATAFFAYCQVRFGRWDLYMRTQEMGWGVHADYLAIFTRRVLHLGWPRPEEFAGDPQWLSRLATLVTMLLFAVFIVLECLLVRGDAATGWRQRAGYYFCAAVMFYLCVSSHATLGLSSMLRFSLPVQVMLVMAGVHLLRDPWRRGRRRSLWAAAGLTLWCVLSFYCQVGMTFRFTHRLWVA